MAPQPKFEQEIKDVSEGLRAAERSAREEIVDEARIAEDIRAVGENLPQAEQQKLEIELRLIALELKTENREHRRAIEKAEHRVNQLLQRIQTLAEYNKLRKQGRKPTPEALAHIREQFAGGTDNPYLRLVYGMLGESYKRGQNDCITTAQLLKQAGIKNADGSDLPYYTSGDQYWREVGRQVGEYNRWDADFYDLTRFRTTDDKVYMFLFVGNPVFRAQKDVQHIAVSDGLGGIIHASSAQGETVIEDFETYLQNTGDIFQQVLVLEIDVNNPAYTAAERLLPSRTHAFSDGSPAPRAEDIPIMTCRVPVYEHGSKEQKMFELTEDQLATLDAITPDPDMQRRIVATIIRETGRGSGTWTRLENFMTSSALLRDIPKTWGPAQLSQYAIPPIEDYFERLRPDDVKKFSPAMQALYRKYKKGPKKHDVGTRKTVLAFEDVREWFNTFEGAAVGIYAITQGNAAAIESAYRAMGQTYPGDQNPDVRVAVDSSFRTGSRPTIIAAQQYMIRRIARHLGIITGGDEYHKKIAPDAGIQESEGSTVYVATMKVDGGLGPTTGQIVAEIFQRTGVNYNYEAVRHFYSQQTSVQRLLQDPIAQELHNVYRSTFHEEPIVVIPAETIRQDESIAGEGYRLRRGLHVEAQREAIYEADLRRFDDFRAQAKKKNPNYPIPEQYERWLTYRDSRIFEQSEMGRITMERQQAVAGHLEKVYARHPELRQYHTYWMAQIRKESSYRWNAISSHGYIGLMQLGPLAALDAGVSIDSIFMGREWIAKREELLIKKSDKAAWEKWQRDVYAKELHAAYKAAYEGGESALQAFQSQYPLFDPERNIEIGTQYYAKQVLPRVRAVYAGIPEDEIIRISFLGYNDIGVSAIVAMQKYGYIPVQSGQTAPELDRETFSGKSRKLRLAGKDTAKKLLQDLAQAAGENGIYWFDETNNIVRWLTPKTIATGYRYLHTIEKWRQQLEGGAVVVSMR